MLPSLTQILNQTGSRPLDRHGDWNIENSAWQPIFRTGNSKTGRRSIGARTCPAMDCDERIGQVLVLA